MFQTIPEFLKAPFGEPEIKSNEMERKYKELSKSKKISIRYTCKVEDNYLLHLKIGSTTNEKEFYDVVLLFFTDDEKVKKERSFRNYYVKFFSNSPSFIYQYAVLYKQHGYLIDLFYQKMDQKYLDTPPKKIDKLSYDKSIYCACRYMEDNQLEAYSVFAFNLRKTNVDNFLRGIKDFEDVKLTSELKSIDRKLNNELKKDGQKKERSKGKKLPTKGVGVSSKVKAKKSTSGIQQSKVKKSTLSTRKR